MKTYCFLIAIMFFSITGCGLIVYGSRQDLKIETNPPGLTAVVGGKSCVTPCNLNVSRKNENVEIIKRNGETFHTELEKTFHPWLIPANFFTYFIGFAVDHMTGATWTIEDVNIKFPQTDTLKEGTDKKEPIDNNIK